MACAFTVFASLNIWHGGQKWPWLAALAGLFLAMALLYPIALNPLNRLWLKFGLLLHKLVNPIMMAFVFFGAVLPTGLVMRFLGKDLLRLKREPTSNTYWIERHPPGPQPLSMKDQF